MPRGRLRLTRRRARRASARLALARWITAPDNPLFARVMVNRLWHYHFGTGLVETPNDFGFNGGRPSHPELLDWLAAELFEQGWGLKALHRLIVTVGDLPAVVAAADRGRCKLDAGNRLLWRHAPHRLEAEAVRDAMLAVCGQLTAAWAGRGYQDFRSYFFKGTQFYDPHRPGRRRASRGGRSTACGRAAAATRSSTPSTAPTPRRPRRAGPSPPRRCKPWLCSTTPSSCTRPTRFADRLRRERGRRSWKSRLRRAYRARLRASAGSEGGGAGRRPFVGEHGLAAFCRVLFNSNEFLYVD